ncbi:MAG: DUF885 domain-containing protein [Deltaproteobacteria bacterium]|jgi:uncharacterized protein (DUF885 family)
MSKHYLPLLLLATACAHAKPSSTAPDATFDAIADAHLKQLYATHPIWATSLGVHDYDDALPDLSAQAVAQRTTAIEALLERLATTEPTTLDDRRRLDHRVLEYALRAEHFELTQVQGHLHDPMVYNRIAARAIASLIDRRFAPTPTRVTSATKRLTELPRVFEQARANLGDVPQLWTELAIKSTAGTVSFLREDVPAALAAQGYADLDDTTKAAFEAAHERGIAAVEAYRAWLEQELLPRSNADPSLGRERFETKLKLEEHFDLDAETLRKMNDEAIERYQAWVAREAKKVDPNRSPAEVMASITAEHPTPEELIATAERYVVDARKFVVDHAILTLPTDALPIVRESPKYARRGFASMSTPGPFERVAREAYYNITNVDPEWDDEKKEQHLTYFNFPGLLGISVHEAMPGHFVQLLYEQQIPSALRQVHGTASLIEGWAHYAEQMMVDEGLGDDDPKIRLGQLRRALQRHARWHAAIAIHVDGQSVEEAAKAFERIAYFAPFPALRETQRATYNPTYLYYALGRMEILALREAVKDVQGDDFSLKAFHDRFLRLGLPIPLARQVMLGGKNAE